MRYVLIFLATLLVAVAVYGTLVEPNHIVVRHVSIPSPPLARFFEDARVVHLSDFQMRSFGRREQKLLDELVEIAPDYVFVTGDFSQKDGDYPGALRLLEQIPAAEGIWGVLGNTDYNKQRGHCILCHTDDSYGELRGDEPIRILRNELIYLERNGRRLALLGLDEYDGSDGNRTGPGPVPVLKKSTEDAARMVIAHTPFCVDIAERRDVDLYLAGDTHGGQIALPDPILQNVMPNKYMKYRTGLFAVGSLWLHVNPGIGWNELPVRLGCPPEITVLDFGGTP